MIWILLAAAAGGLAGGAVHLTLTGLLRRMVRELQYGLADLEDRLVREVKKRAAAARWEEGSQEREEPLDPAALKKELRTGFLSPAEFARRKSERRMRRGPEDRQVPEEAG